VKNIHGITVSRRHFLSIAAGTLVTGGLARFLPLATPPPGNRREYFVPLANYHELPPECYAPDVIRPQEIILHWDGNRHERKLWVAPMTYETLRYLGFSAHFAVDYQCIWQMLPMYTTVVQHSYGATGYNHLSINIELAGRDFDTPGYSPPDNEVRLAIRLVAQLMDFYGIAFEHVVGHVERDPRGNKKDPGVKFLAYFRQRLNDYRTRLTPLKHTLATDF